MYSVKEFNTETIFTQPWMLARPQEETVEVELHRSGSVNVFPNS